MTDSTSYVAKRPRELAIGVRRIGDGWREDLEAIAAAKDDVAKRLVHLAQEIEHG